MSIRPVFVAKATYPYFEEIHVNVDWHQGFALSQKRKNQISLHQNFLAAYPDKKVLEVSSSSTEPIGYWLSAMHLKKITADEVTTVENVFQENRIYIRPDGSQIGPFPEAHGMSPKECKKYVKSKAGNAHSYRYAYGEHIIPAPDYHISLFYDFVYLNILMRPENEYLRSVVLDRGYDSFTDLATTSLNSQARSCAIFVGLAQAGLLDELTTIEGYMKLMRTDLETGKPLENAYENTQPFIPKLKSVKLLHEVVPSTFSRDQVLDYFNTHYKDLSNSPRYVPVLVE